jgi:hypothetical protein
VHRGGPGVQTVRPGAGVQPLERTEHEALYDCGRTVRGGATSAARGGVLRRVRGCPSGVALPGLQESHRRAAGGHAADRGHDRRR